MNAHRLFILAAVVCCTAATLFFAPSTIVPEARAEAPSIEKWEYLTKANWTRPLAQKQANELGAEGWELVAVAGEAGKIWVFKRRFQ